MALRGIYYLTGSKNDPVYQSLRYRRSADSQVWGYLEVGGEEAVGVGAGVARRGRHHLRHLGAAAAAGVNPDKQEMVTIVPTYNRFHIHDTMLNTKQASTLSKLTWNWA